MSCLTVGLQGRDDVIIAVLLSLRKALGYNINIVTKWLSNRSSQSLNWIQVCVVFLKKLFKSFYHLAALWAEMSKMALMKLLIYHLHQRSIWVTQHAGIRMQGCDEASPQVDSMRTSSLTTGRCVTLNREGDEAHLVTHSTGALKFQTGLVWCPLQKSRKSESTVCTRRYVCILTVFQLKYNEKYFLKIIISKYQDNISNTAGCRQTVKTVKIHRVWIIINLTLSLITLKSQRAL